MNSTGAHYIFNKDFIYKNKFYFYIPATSNYKLRVKEQHDL